MFLKLCRYKFDVIEINYWNENKELCLWNDKYRRSLNSNQTIKNGKLELPDMVSLKRIIKR